METTDLRVMEHKVAGARKVWVRAPSGARYGLDPDAPAVTGGGYLLPPSGASWDDGPDPAGLERAKRAGMAALAEGHGSVLPNGMAPCGTCPACDAGYPQRCRRPQSKAMATLRAAQARDADRTRDQVVAAELAMLHVELSAALD